MLLCTPAWLLQQPLTQNRVQLIWAVKYGVLKPLWIHSRSERVRDRCVWQREREREGGEKGSERERRKSELVWENVNDKKSTPTRDESWSERHLVHLIAQTFSSFRGHDSSDGSMHIALLCTGLSWWMDEANVAFYLRAPWPKQLSS